MRFAREKHISEYLKSLDESFTWQNVKVTETLVSKLLWRGPFKLHSRKYTLSPWHPPNLSAFQQSVGNVRSAFVDFSSSLFYLWFTFAALFTTFIFLSLTGCFFSTAVQALKTSHLLLADPCTSLEISIDHCLSLTSCLLAFNVSLVMHWLPWSSLEMPMGC